MSAGPRTKIEWLASLTVTDREFAERLPKSPIIHMFDWKKHPIRFTTPAK